MFPRSAGWLRRACWRACGGRQGRQAGRQAKQLVWLAGWLAEEGRVGQVRSGKVGSARFNGKSGKVVGEVGCWFVGFCVDEGRARVGGGQQWGKCDREMNTTLAHSPALSSCACWRGGQFRVAELVMDETVQRRRSAFRLSCGRVVQVGSEAIILVEDIECE
jgi:hypothetical protein